LRIAFYVPHADFLKPEIGGDNAMARGLLEGFIERGHVAEVVSLLDPSDFARGRISALRLAREALSVRRRARRLSADTWVVYSPTEGRPDLFGWWQRPKRYLLFAAHAPDDEPSSESWRTSLLSYAHRRALARADAVSAWRPRGMDRLRAYGIPEERLRLLLPAAPPWQSMPSREQARLQLDLPQEVPVVLCAGRFSTDKRGRPKKTQIMLDLIDAVADIPSETVLLIVGEGPGRSLLERKAAEAAPAGRVRIMGPAGHAEMCVFYAACDVYAYPSWKDYTWVSVLEAQSCGRPVVTMRTRSAELSVQDGRTGMLASDLGEFRTHLAALVPDRVRCESMGRAAREYVARAHTMDARVRQMEDLLLGRSERELPSAPAEAPSVPARVTF
jgi:glycosyltransferase involved in cell wall biosynthesis